MRTTPASKWQQSVARWHLSLGWTLESTRADWKLRREQEEVDVLRRDGVIGFEWTTPGMQRQH